MHRIVAPQPREEAVPSVFGIEVRVADVDLVERHRPGIAMRLGLEVDGADRGDEVVHWVFQSLFLFRSAYHDRTPYSDSNKHTPRTPGVCRAESPFEPSGQRQVCAP